MGDVVHGRGCVYSLQYHVVWAAKYRRDVLRGAVESDLKDVLRQVAESQRFSIDEMETMPDHVHLLVSASPRHSIPEMVKALKGVSARRLFQLHPELKQRLRGGHLWSPSHFVATVSENTEAQAQAHIQGQKARP